MKTAQNLFALLISSLLLTTACTPQDKAVVDKNLRADIQAANARKAGGSRSQGNSTDFSLRDYGLASLLVERQIEAVELVKLAMGSLEDVQTQYAVEKQSADEQGLEKVLIKNKDPLEFANEDGPWKTVVLKNLEASVKQSEQETLVDVKATGRNKVSIDSLDKDKKRFFVNLIDSSYELKLISTKDPSQYQLTVSAKGSIEGAKGSKNSKSDVDFEISMLIDKASLQSSEVIVLSSAAKVNYPGVNGRTFFSEVKASDVKIKVTGLCSEMVGSVTVAAGPKKTFKAELGQEEIKINQAAKKLATCGKRPTVDLSRLLFF